MSSSNKDLSKTGKRKPYGPVESLPDSRIALFEVRSIAKGETPLKGEAALRKIIELTDGIISTLGARGMNALCEQGSTDRTAS